MGRVLGVLLLLSAAAAPPALAQSKQEQVENHRADAAQRRFDGCSPSAAFCPSMRRSSLRFDRSEGAREARAFNDGLEAALAAGDCEGARAKAVDAGRHELAARIRRACKAAPDRRLPVSVA